MKNFLLFSIGMLICTSGFSQLQRVGIGTLSPAFKLDVRNGSINTDSVYRIGTITVLAVPGDGNLFIGKAAGKVNTGYGNTFSGQQAGRSNTTGAYNSFFGTDSGLDNLVGDENSFFGAGAGTRSVGLQNSFFGSLAGYYNTTGFNNVFVGKDAGGYTEEGHSNTFVGTYSGSGNTTGTANTALGYSAYFSSGELTNATAIGTNARADCSNCMVLGSVIDVNSAPASVKVGIGINNPTAVLDVAGAGGNGTAVFRGTTNISHINYGEDEDTYIRAGKDFGNVIINDILGGKVGIGTNTPLANLHVFYGASGNITPFGPLVVESENNTYINLLSPNANETAVLFGKADNAASGGIVYNNSTTLNGFQFRTNGNTTQMKLYSNGDAWLMGILDQASDIRLKKDLHRLDNSLQNIIQLNGYNYHWADPELNSGLQTGVIAQEVQKIFPELVKEDAEGMLSVNYSGLIPVLIESIKEQQSQIDALTLLVEISLKQ